MVKLKIYNKIAYFENKKINKFIKVNYGDLMIKVIRGYKLIQLVNTSSSKMIIKGDDFKAVINNIEDGGKYYIIAPADETANWKSGTYKYQILNDEGMEDEGDITVIENFELTDTYETVKSKNELLLEAIEAQIAGRATSNQQSMTVGDKSIAYCTIDELFKLREYFKKKVSEEQGDTTIDGDEMKIKYKWGFR